MTLADILHHIQETLNLDDNTEINNLDIYVQEDKPGDGVLSEVVYDPDSQTLSNQL